MTLRPRSLAAVLLVFACSSDNLLSPQELRELGRAESRWNARAFPDYSYEIQQLCFCPPELNQWTRVSVRGGQVVAAVAVEPDAQFPPTTITYWQPIDSLFARLRQTASDHASSGVYADVIVTFDATLGYPTYIEWKERPNVADAGAIYHVRNVLPLN
jgi:hypothetical protein